MSVKRSHKRISLPLVLIVTGMMVLIFQLFLESPVQADSGAFPANMDYYVQINYSISGASLDQAEDNMEGFTVSRRYNGKLTGRKLTVSGNVAMTAYASHTIHVSVQAGDNTDNQSFDIEMREQTQSFEVSVDIPRDAKGGSFQISHTGHSPYGSRGIVVSGSLEGTGRAAATTERVSRTDDDTDDARKTERADASDTSGIGSMPGPDGVIQTIVAVVLPAAVIILIGLLNRPGLVPPGSGFGPDSNPTGPYDSGYPPSAPVGTETITNPDGSIETYYPDGSATRHDPDGTVSERSSNDILTVRNPDGSVETHYPDGSGVRHFPDGTVTERDIHDVQTIRYPNGSYTRYYPDGRYIVSEENGLYSIFDAEHTQIGVGSEDGSVHIDLQADGLAVIRTKYGGQATYDPQKGNVFESIIDGTILLSDQGDSFGRNGDVIRLELKEESFVREENLADGTVYVEDANGQGHYDPNSGQIEIKGKDGSILRGDADGNAFYYDADTQTTCELDSSTGTIAVTGPEGEAVTIESNGSVTIGETRWEKLEDGSYRTQTTDGTTVIRQPDGRSILESSDGAKAVIESDGSVTVTETDGTVTQYGP